MSKGLGDVVKRAISDAAFRRQLQSDPNGALKGFHLTGDERAALRSGDASKLSSLGIDQRMSKAFAMGEGASVASKVGGVDFQMGAAITDGGAARHGNALVPDGVGNARDALIASGDESDSSAARIADSTAARASVTGEGTGVRTAFGGDQHDGGRAAIGGSEAASVDNTETERLARVNASFEASDNLGSASTARDDQHDGGRAAIGGSEAASVDNTETERLARVNASFEASDNAGSAFMTSTEMDEATAQGRASYPDSADTQSEALANDAAITSPEGHPEPDTTV